MEPEESDDEILFEHIEVGETIIQVDEDTTKNFNNEQRKAFLGIKDFIDSLCNDKMVNKKKFRCRRYTLLNGPGGSGKTYIISTLINLLKKIKNFRYAVLAPTHKAVSIIIESLNMHVNTVAKYLGFTMEIDNDGNEIDTVFPTTTTSSSVGGGQSHNNMQPFIVLRYLIKY